MQPSHLFPNMVSSASSLNMSNKSLKAFLLNAAQPQTAGPSGASGCTAWDGAWLPGTGPGVAGNLVGEPRMHSARTPCSGDSHLITPPTEGK